MMNRIATTITLACLAPAAAADGEILQFQTINELEGGLGFVLDDDDRFGAAVDRIGDLDGDGLGDLIVGAPGDDDAGTDEGAAWILFLNADGSVRERQKVLPPLASASFGQAVAQVGDVNLDGTNDVAIAREGAIEILGLLQSSPPVVINRISATDYPGAAFPQNEFGASLARLSDLNADGYSELAVGEPRLDLGGPDRGAVHVFDLAPSAGGVVVPLLATIGTASGGFLGSLGDGDEFGRAIASPGDVDGDGVADLVVTAPDDDTTGSNDGAFWTLFLNPDGTVGSERKLTSLDGAPAALFDAIDFGEALASLGDFDGAGAPDLLMAGEDLHVLFLRSDGTVRSFVRHREPDVTGLTDGWDAVCATGDHDGDGLPEIVVGAPRAETTGDERGEIHVLFMDAVQPAAVQSYGCGTGPPGSIDVSDAPYLGGSFEFLVDNPLGTQSPGSLPFVAVGLDDLATPCGLPLPGFHMSPLAPNGELLVADLVVPELWGAPWTGPGQPAAVPAAIPQDAGLLGLSLFTQGLLFDPSGGPSGAVLFGLTRGLELRIGT